MPEQQLQAEKQDKQQIEVRTSGVVEEENNDDGDFDDEGMGSVAASFEDYFVVGEGGEEGGGGGVDPQDLMNYQMALEMEQEQFAADGVDGSGSNGGPGLQFVVEGRSGGVGDKSSRPMTIIFSSKKPSDSDATRGGGSTSTTGGGGGAPSSSSLDHLLGKKKQHDQERLDDELRLAAELAEYEDWEEEGGEDADEELEEGEEEQGEGREGGESSCVVDEEGEEYWDEADYEVIAIDGRRRTKEKKANLDDRTYFGGELGNWEYKVLWNDHSSSWESRLWLIDEGYGPMLEKFDKEKKSYTEPTSKKVKAHRPPKPTSSVAKMSKSDRKSLARMLERNRQQREALLKKYQTATESLKRSIKVPSTATFGTFPGSHEYSRIRSIVEAMEFPPTSSGPAYAPTSNNVERRNCQQRKNKKKENEIEEEEKASIAAKYKTHTDYFLMNAARWFYEDNLQLTDLTVVGPQVKTLGEFCSSAGVKEEEQGEWEAEEKTATTPAAPVATGVSPAAPTSDDKDVTSTTTTTTSTSTAGEEHKEKKEEERAEAEGVASGSDTVPPKKKKEYRRASEPLAGSRAKVTPLVHGTSVFAFSSIAQHGLRVPGTLSGVKVVNGSAYGVGIYTARKPNISTSYVRNCSTMLICAGVDPKNLGGGDKDGKSIRLGHNVNVYFRSDYVVPLFYAKFKRLGHYSSTSFEELPPPNVHHYGQTPSW